MAHAMRLLPLLLLLKVFAAPLLLLPLLLLLSLLLLLTVLATPMPLLPLLLQRLQLLLLFPVPLQALPALLRAAATTELWLLVFLLIC